MSDLESALQEKYEEVQFYRNLIGQYVNSLKGKKVREAQLKNIVRDLDDYEEKYNAQSMLMEVQNEIHEDEIQIAIYKERMNEVMTEHKRISRQIECNEIMDNICKAGHYNW